MTDPYIQAGAGSGGWSSQSDVSITTDPSSEMSTGTSATTIPDIRIITDKYYGDNLSISQVSFPFYVTQNQPSLVLLLIIFHMTYLMEV